MPPKKGPVKTDEKKIRMVELLQERKTVFQIEELETLAYKEKGIVPNTVKPVAKLLVDDGLINGEKVGQSMYYWSFPSETTNRLKRKIETLNDEVSDVKDRVKRMRQTVEQESHGKEDSTENDDILETLTEMRTRKEHLLLELKNYEQCDPKKLKEKQEFIVIAKDAANRWTDNIYQIHKWLKEKTNYSSAEIKEAFELDDDIDYVE